MIQRREDIGLVIVTGVGAFPFGVLRVSRNVRGGLDLYDTARERYLFIRQASATFGAADDVSALRRVQDLLEPPNAFSGYGDVPAGSVQNAITYLANTKQDVIDEDYVALFESALEDL